MSQTQFCGYGSTLDQALTAASEQAIKSWKPAGPDDMARLKVESLNVLYGGIIGHVGTRVACLSIAGGAGGASTLSAAPAKAELTLKLEVLPDVIYANLMPPVRHPQPHNVVLMLTVANIGKADFQGQSPDSAVARFSVLKGRTTIWNGPLALPVLTSVTIHPGESKTYAAIWDVKDVADPQLVDADLHAVALFVPSGDSAIHRIQIKPVF
jgi:hypothetical protein